MFRVIITKIWNLMKKIYLSALVALIAIGNTTHAATETAASTEADEATQATPSLIRLADSESKEDSELYTKITGKSNFDASTKDGRNVIFSHANNVAWRLGVMPIGNLGQLPSSVQDAYIKAAEACEIIPQQVVEPMVVIEKLKSTKFGFASVWAFGKDTIDISTASCRAMAKALQAIMAVYNVEDYTTGDEVQFLPEAQHIGEKSRRFAAGCLQYLPFPTDMNDPNYATKLTRAAWMSKAYELAGFTLVTHGDTSFSLVPFMSGKPDSQLWVYKF